jgi:hypothetical protein
MYRSREERLVYEAELNGLADSETPRLPCGLLARMLLEITLNAVIQFQMPITWLNGL